MTAEMLVGIDLGTTNSAVALWRDGASRLVPNAMGKELTPSAVSLAKGGQDARLPAAQQLIANVIPEGTRAEMMDKMFDGLLGPIMAEAPNGAATIGPRKIGTVPFALELEEDKAAELAKPFNPAWAERQQREMALLPEMMKEMVALLEPGMRKTMAELYAIRFSDCELAEIDAFFSTGTGGKYARESFLMASDPRIMASTMEPCPR